jgi:hypothetical protein
LLKKRFGKSLSLPLRLFFDFIRGGGLASSEGRGRGDERGGFMGFRLIVSESVLEEDDDGGFTFGPIEVVWLGCEDCGDWGDWGDWIDWVVWVVWIGWDWVWVVWVVVLAFEVVLDVSPVGVAMSAVCKVLAKLVKELSFLFGWAEALRVPNLDWGANTEKVLPSIKKSLAAHPSIPPKWKYFLITVLHIEILWDERSTPR